MTSAEIVPTPSYLDCTQADLVLLRLTGMSLEKIAEKIDGPVEWVTEQLENPDARAELVRRRRDVLSAVGDAAAAVVGQGLDIVEAGMKRDPEDTALALQAIRSASPLLAKQVNVDVSGGVTVGADEELKGSIAFLLEQADRHRLKLVHGAAAELDGVIDGEVISDVIGDVGEGWDLL